MHDNKEQACIHWGSNFIRHLVRMQNAKLGCVYLVRNLHCIGLVSAAESEIYTKKKIPVIRGPN